MRNNRVEGERVRGIDLTCAALFLNTGRNRCLQYWWNRTVPIRSGMVNPVAAVERFSPNTPIAINWATSNEKTVVLWAIGHNCPPPSYFVTYTLSIWKMLVLNGSLFLKIKNN